ncbi:MAG: CoA pyrophosphatase [Deinococcota bacterium]
MTLAKPLTTLTNDLLERLKSYFHRNTPSKLEMPEFRAAAVLVVLVHTPQSWQVLFTVRSQHLPNHAGQIAFPGGKVEAGETLEQAALRECAEEVGLSLPADALLGQLDDQLSPFGYIVTPLVATCKTDDLGMFLTTLSLGDGEVAEVFCAPLNDLMTIRPRYETRSLNGLTRTLHYYQWSDRLIWGLTGNVLAELLEAVQHISHHSA